MSGAGRADVRGGCTGPWFCPRQSTDDPQRVLQWHAAHGGFVHGAVRACQLPGLGWALCAQAPVSSGTVLVTTPGSLLWTAFDKRAPQAAPLAPGERLASASAQLRRRLVAAQAAGEPFVEAMHPPDSIPLQMVAGSVLDPPPEAAVGALKGTTLLQHTLSLRSRLLEAIGPELRAAKDAQAFWEASVWAQAVIMSRAFHVPKDSDRLALIPIVDIANHAPTYQAANAEIRDNPDGSISMVASRDIASNEEVCICYGEYSNEQLLFCYGFVIPNNPCQGLLCPLPVPDTAGRAQLLQRALRRLRATSKVPAEAFAALRSGKDGAIELLSALKVWNMPEDEAQAMLKEGMEITPGFQEFASALDFLEAWRKEIPAGEDVESYKPARLLQSEARELIENAIAEVSSQLPWPLYLRFCLRKVIFW
ncbi:unnamed protein product [Effrenium voratum]|nr:unnamed protein product [Effrenium voratum]